MAQVRGSAILGVLGLLIAGAHGRVPTAVAPAMAHRLGAVGAPAPAAQDELSLLFIQQTRSGMLVMDKNSSQEGTLVLKGVGQHTIWFTDRPGRSAGQMETQFFLGSKFTDAHGDWLSKPNAALYISKPGTSASSDIIVIVTLSKPAFDAANGTLTYKVNIVPGNSTLGSSKPMQKGSLISSYVKVAQDPTTPTMLSEIEGGELVFDSAVLFIDCFGLLGLGLGLGLGLFLG